MSKTIQDALDLPILEDLLRASRPSAPIEDETSETSDNQIVDDLAVALNQNRPPILDTGSTDHATKTDDIHDEVLRHAQDLMDLGYNIDTRSAGRIFETAAGMYKIALDAKNSKRDAQLKLMKLELEHKKIDALLKGRSNDSNVVPGEHVVVIEDRNTLIKQMRNNR